MRRILAAMLAAVVTVTTGVPLLPNTLGGYRIAYEAAFGANLTDADGSGWTWTEITTEIRHAGPIVGSLGRTDAFTTPPAAGIKLIVDNPDGRWTPFHPLGSHYPQVRPGLPLRRRISPDRGVTWYTRWQGYAVDFTRTSITTGGLATVTITGAGIRERLAQDDPLFSAGRRSYVASAPLALWTGEDGVLSTSVASALPAGAPLTPSSSSAAPAFSTDNPGGTAGSVDVSAGVQLAGPVPVSTSQTWTVDIWVRLASGSGLNTTPWLGYTPGSSNGFWKLLVVGGGSPLIRLSVTTVGGTQTNIVDVSPGIDYFDDRWHLFTATTTSDGVNVSGNVYIDGVLQPGTHLSAAGALNHPPTTLVVNGLYGDTDISRVGPVAVWDFDTGATADDRYSAGLGWIGEAPYTRAARLCAEENIDLVVVDYNPTTGRTMGVQAAAKLIDLLDQCATADAAVLHDGLGPGFRWQNIAQRYDQTAALTLAAAELAEVPEPVTTNRWLHNRAVVSRTGGGTEVAVDSDGQLGTDAVGVYSVSVTAELESDVGLADRAGWEVHAGTVPGERIDQLVVDVAATPALAARLLATTNGWSGPVLPGWRVDVTRLSDVDPAHPPGDLPLVIEGWSEEIDPAARWRLKLAVAPQRTYDVWKLEDATLGRLRTDGHTLAAGASAGATSLSLATPSGKPLWTIDAGDFPMYLDIAGIKVTVSVITGTSSPQTATVTGVVKDLASGEPVSMWRNGVIKL